MRSALVVLVVAGCGVDHQDHPLEWCASGQTLFAVREGTGAWQTPTPANGRYSVAVSGDYQVISVTVHPSSVTVFEALGTAAEIEPIGACSDTSTATVSLTAQLAKPGTAALDGDNESVSTPGPVTLASHVGTHDLVVTTAYPDPNPNGAVSIRHGLAVSPTTTLGTLDPSVDGMPLVPVSINVTGATAAISTDTYLETANGDVAWVAMGGTATASTVPAGLLAAGDEQWLDVYAGDQFATAKFTGTQTTFAMPPPLTGITFGADGGTASWTTLPTYSGVDLFRFATSNVELVSATRGWLDAHHATSIGFITDVPPGFDPSWTSAAAPASFSMWHEDGDITYGSSVSQPSAAARRLSPRSVHRDLVDDRGPAFRTGAR